MEAWILDESPGTYRYGETDIPGPTEGQVKVRIVTSALNHLDIWVTRGMPKPILPLVPGGDGAGVVEEVGSGVERWSPGDEVVLNPSIACGHCATCLAGQSVYCPSFGIMGEAYWGAHGSHVVVGAHNLVAKPRSASWEEAAAYGLCGLTAYRMLRRAELRAGQSVLVVGIGGGVATACQVIASKMGATVYVTSRDPAKRARALQLGAADAFDSASAEDWPVRADVVVDDVGTPTWSRSLRALAPGGRLVVCGGTGGAEVTLNLPRLFFRQHQIIGSTMGTFEEFAEVTRLVDQGLPVIVDSVLPLARYPDALARLEAGEQLGKIILRH